MARGVSAASAQWDWFAQFQLDVPLLIQNQYRPGTEFDTAAGLAYKGLSLGNVQIIPLGQAFFSARASDSEANADPDSAMVTAKEPPGRPGRGPKMRSNLVEFSRVYSN